VFLAYPPLGYGRSLILGLSEAFGGVLGWGAVRWWPSGLKRKAAGGGLTFEGAGPAMGALGIVDG
jgi:hypothetical protein